MTVNRKHIVITGGIASGKSKVSSYLMEKGYPLVDADVAAREVVLPGSEGLVSLVAHFGETILREEELDREKLGQILFSEAEAREQVNAILHPLIFRWMGERGASFHEGIIFYDIPLYYEVEEKVVESGMKFDEVWVVTVSEEIQVARLMKRDQIDRDYAKQKIASQMPLREKEKRADVIIRNDGSLGELYEKVEAELRRVEGNR